MNKKEALKRLKVIKKAIKAENVSYSQLIELQAMKKYIVDDVELLQWAGVKE